MDNYFKGMLLGFAIGDALGTPHEFPEYEEIEYTGKLEKQFTCHELNVYLDIGQYSDDTEMTLTLLRSILKNKQYIPKNVINEYIEWSNAGNTIQGLNTFSLFYRSNYGSYFTKYMDKFKTNPLLPFVNITDESEQSQSNGSLMRSIPLILLNDEDIKQDIWITNPSNFVLKYQMIYINILRFCINEKDKQLINVFLYENFINEINEEIDNSKKGWIKTTISIILKFLLEYLNNNLQYNQIIDKIILFGGDTDTNAALLGGIIGLIEGIDKMNNNEITKYNINIVLNFNKRNDKYLLKDIDELIDNFVILYNEKIIN